MPLPAGAIRGMGRGHRPADVLRGALLNIGRPAGEIEPIAGKAAQMGRLASLGALLLATLPPADPPPRLVPPRPGLRVDDRPPRGWTHLVAKSVPSLSTGDLGTLPASAGATATRFRTAILAEVVRSAAGVHSLRRVGAAMCVPGPGGGDVVVTADSAEGLGIDLGTIDGLVLARAEAELARGRLAARSPTFALYRTPCRLVWEGKHADVMLYYAIIVDPDSGALRVGVWPGMASADAPIRPTDWVEVRPGTTFDCKLDVSASTLLGAVPYAWSFAMNQMPPGTRRTMPAALRGWANRSPRTAEEVDALEAAVRQAMGKPKEAEGR